MFRSDGGPEQLDEVPGVVGVLLAIGRSMPKRTIDDDGLTGSAQRAVVGFVGVEVDLGELLQARHTDLASRHATTVADGTEAHDLSIAGLDGSDGALDGTASGQQVLNDEYPLALDAIGEAEAVDDELLAVLVGPQRGDVQTLLVEQPVGGGAGQGHTAGGRRRDDVELQAEGLQQAGHQAAQSNGIGVDGIHADVARAVLAGLVDEVLIEEDGSDALELVEDVHVLSDHESIMQPGGHILIIIIWS